MFMRLATSLPPVTAQDILRLHPAELVALLEQGWNARRRLGSRPGSPDSRSALPGLVVPAPPLAELPHVEGVRSDTFVALSSRLAAVARTGGVLWDHLIYAYMIENTRIYEIFRRVVHEFLHGEKLGAPGSADTQLWLRSTEELFYRDPPPFAITSVSSHIRPDLRATRRNAYYRMFGMDLNHGGDDNAPYAYVKAEAANSEFVATFEELLREVWIGHTHRTATTANPTDDARIADLTTKLHEMLTTRRQNGNLAREEFFFVSMMSWFHLAVSSDDLAIVKDLRAQGASAEQRLFKIAEKIGLPAHGLSRSYFEIAVPIATVLSLIETGAMNTVGAARGFYDPLVDPVLTGLMNKIIMHWSTISGRDMKARKVATAA